MLQKAREARSVAKTDMNAVSSRSHSIFRLKIRGANKLTGATFLFENFTSHIHACIHTRLPRIYLCFFTFGYLCRTPDICAVPRIFVQSYPGYLCNRTPDICAIVPRIFLPSYLCPLTPIFVPSYPGYVSHSPPDICTLLTRIFFYLSIPGICAFLPRIFVSS